MKLLSTTRNVDVSFSWKQDNKHGEWDCYGQRSDICVLTVGVMVAVDLQSYIPVSLENIKVPMQPVQIHSSYDLYHILTLVVIFTISFLSLEIIHKWGSFTKLTI
jgi:hypothetical protein